MMQYLKFTSLILSSIVLTACLGNGSKPIYVDANVKSSLIDVPSQAATDFTLAIDFMNNNKLSMAENSFKKMITEYPMLSGPYANLGVIYSKKNKWELAQKYLNMAVQKNRHNLKAMNQLGYAYRQNGDFVKAEESYKAAVKMRPNDAVSYLNLGVLYDIYMGKFIKASEFYQKYQSLQDSPDRKVAGWIVDINRRTGASIKKNQVASEGAQ